MFRVLVVISFLLAAIPVLAGKTLNFALPDDEVDHVSLAVLQAAYDRLNIRVTGELMPAGRALAESDVGRTDGEVNRIAAIEQEHANLIRVDVPINFLDGVAYTCNPSLTVKDWDDLHDLRIGVRLGIRFAEQATRGMPNVTYANDYDKLFDLLVLHRLDVVISSRQVGYSQSRRPGCEKLRSLEPPLESLPLYHYLHKRHAELVPAITRILQQMTDSGEIAAIREHATRQYRALNSK